MSEIIKKSRKQKIAENEVESFRNARGPFVVAAETTRMAMVFTDAKEAGKTLSFLPTSPSSLSPDMSERRCSAKALTS